jgi:hypothetical protein
MNINNQTVFSLALDFVTFAEIGHILQAIPSNFIENLKTVGDLNSY